MWTDHLYLWLMLPYRVRLLPFHRGWERGTQSFFKVTFLRDGSWDISGLWNCWLEEDFNSFLPSFVSIWLCWMSAARRFSLAAERGLPCGVQASHCGGFSVQKNRLGHTGFRSCGTWSWLPHNMWNLPRPWTSNLGPLRWQVDFLPLGPGKL